MYAYLWDRLNWLEQEIETLKKENEAMKKKIASIQPVSIERMEYKIQELQIQTLSGTLNVGLTANGDEKSIAQIIEKMTKEGRSSFDLGELGNAKGASQPPVPVDRESSSSQSSPPEIQDADFGGSANRPENGDGEKDHPTER